jgi:hypothetical protein
MTERSGTVERYAGLSAICLALPETTREDKGQHAAFLVRKKIFVYYLNNHHNDGVVGLWCRVMPDENRFLVEADPRRYYLPAYVASRGWVGLRLDLPELDWTEVKELVRGSYMQIAPKKLAAVMKG